MNAQQNFLKLLCEELGLLEHLQAAPEKKDYKNVLLIHGGQQLSNRLSALLKNDSRYVERLEQKLTLCDQLEWALKATIDNALDEWVNRQGKRNGFAVVRDKYGNLKLQNSAYQPKQGIESQFETY